MRFRILLLLILLAAVLGNAQTPPKFTIEGHRGARGYLPENTIPSFKKALDQGADTLELDVVISKDRKVVVSHEPWFNSVISLDPSGNRIPADKQKENNIYKLNYSEVKLFDVGSIGHKDFLLQEKMKAIKPLLSDVFREINAYAKSKKLPPPRINVEIKTEGVAGDNVFHPAPADFAKLVYADIKKAKMLKHVIVQSFDVRPLQEIHKLDAKLPIAILVGGTDGIDERLKTLGFQPDTYSPHYGLVNAALVAECRRRGIKLVPWTVNEIADLERMKQFDLDGIISDYPDRVVKIFR